MLKSSHRWLIILSLAIAIPLGLLSKKYNGFGDRWVNDSAGDILYEFFWCLFIFLFIPISKKAVNIIPVVVFALTCVIEFLQLWHPPFLEPMRSHFLWRLLLGNTFSWWDFPHYAFGCAISWLWLRLILYFTIRPKKKVL